MLSQTEEQDLARLAAGGDTVAFERLVSSHLRLVFSMVFEFRSFKLPFDELLSEGLTGLVIACRRFDPDLGTRLAPYAALWIRAQLRRYTLANRRIVRSPGTRNARKILSRLSKTRRELTQAQGEPPDNDAIARALGVTTAEVDDIAVALSARDLPYGVEVTGRAFEACSDTVAPDSSVQKTEERLDSARRLEQALGTLGPRERHILEQRYLADCTLDDLGRELGISRERVRQLEARAKAEVRSAIAS
jgi:RNA polymerase sigma-32 factor